MKSVVKRVKVALVNRVVPSRVVATWHGRVEALQPQVESVLAVRCFLWLREHWPAVASARRYGVGLRLLCLWCSAIFRSGVQQVLVCGSVTTIS